MPGNLTEVYLRNEFACLHRPVSLSRPKNKTKNFHLPQILAAGCRRPHSPRCRSGWARSLPRTRSSRGRLTSRPSPPHGACQWPPSTRCSACHHRWLRKNKGLLRAHLLITQSAHRWWGTWRSCPSPPGRWARPGRNSGSSNTASRQTSPCHILPRDQRRSRSWQSC